MSKPRIIKQDKTIHPTQEIYRRNFPKSETDKWPLVTEPPNPNGEAPLEFNVLKKESDDG